MVRGLSLIHIYLFYSEGADAWFTRAPSEYLQRGVKCETCGCTELTPEKDILDVWWESGVSQTCLLYTSIPVAAGALSFMGLNLNPMIAAAAMSPVSYTHLDVYKRQALEGMFREELGDELLDEVNGGMAKYRLYLHEPFLKTTSAASQKIKIIKG